MTSKYERLLSISSKDLRYVALVSFSYKINIIIASGIYIINGSVYLRATTITRYTSCHGYNLSPSNKYFFVIKHWPI